MELNEIQALIARAAHELWCLRMREQEWRYGSVYDEAKRLHDALVPFENLGRDDRLEALRAVDGLALVEQLPRELIYDRGPERQFTAAEMRVGLRVSWAKDVADPKADPAGEFGSVESWEIDPATGEVLEVRVRWDDGELSEHVASACELRRVKP